MRAEAFETRYRLSKLGKPVDRTEWDMTPPTVNAYYNPTMNEIVFPAGILQPPFFNAGRRRCGELRRHRRGDRPRDHPRLRRPGEPLRRRREHEKLVDLGGSRAIQRQDRQAGQAIRRLRCRSTICTSTAG